MLEAGNDPRDLWRWDDRSVLIIVRLSILLLAAVRTFLSLLRHGCCWSLVEGEVLLNYHVW